MYCRNCGLEKSVKITKEIMKDLKEIIESSFRSDNVKFKPLRNNRFNSKSAMIKYEIKSKTGPSFVPWIAAHIKSIFPFLEVEHTSIGVYNSDNGFVIFRITLKDEEEEIGWRNRDRFKKVDEKDIDKLIEELEEMGIYGDPKKGSKKKKSPKEEMDDYNKGVKDMMKCYICMKSIRGSGINRCEYCKLPCKGKHHKECQREMDKHKNNSKEVLEYRKKYGKIMNWLSSHPVSHPNYRKIKEEEDTVYNTLEELYLLYPSAFNKR